MYSCGQSAVSLEGTASTEAAPFSALTPAQFSERMNSDSQVVVVDLRTDDECNEGIIPGALMVDFYQEEKMKRAMANWDPSRTYLVYCRSGGRSGQTLDIMKARGFENVYHLEGGMNAWIRAGRPVAAP
jgi:rhodanese-related sulfurtransferase